MKKTLKTVFALVLAIVSLCTMTVPALAAEKPKINQIVLWENQNESYVLRIDNLPEGATFVSITSSKPAVVAVEGNSLQSLSAKGLKAGTSKITVKYKVKGKTKSVSANITVYKYSQPLSSLKVNGKSVNLKENKFKFTTSPILSAKKDTKIKISYKAASGWKVTKSYAWIDYTKTVYFENGESFTVPKGSSAYVLVMLEDKKGRNFHYTIWLK